MRKKIEAIAARAARFRWTRSPVAVNSLRGYVTTRIPPRSSSNPEAILALIATAGVGIAFLLMLEDADWVILLRGLIRSRIFTG